MAQPNLSRAIKELEENLGIIIFNRTSRGMFVTPDGEEFLQYARKILEQIDEIKRMYTKEKYNKQAFSISAPYSIYISYAFSEFVNHMNKNIPMELIYEETSSKNTINNIVNSDSKLGIIRYPVNHDKYFKEKFSENELSYEIIAEFSYLLTMSKSHSLAQNKKVKAADLKNYIEIIYVDSSISYPVVGSVKKDELAEHVDKKIFVSEKTSQFDLLERTAGTFMWSPPLTEKFLDRYNLVQKPCETKGKIYKDTLIYKSNYQLSKNDNLFISELYKAKEKYLKNAL